ncbi:MAG TPA: hypothetical protein PLP29_02190 [Candidatus Ozemobacteraceae bacterium]|nr:hypothetical protein [Candidatus Ozemobacteraceae bacterium]
MIRSSNAPRHLLPLLLIALLALFTQLPAGAEDALDNGIKPVFGKAFNLALFGSRAATGDEMRSFKKLTDSLRDAEKKVSGWGIPLNRKVRIMLYTDTGFPCSNIWVAAGLTPNDASLDKFSDDNSLLYATVSGYEMAHQTDLLNDTWFFVNPLTLRKKYAAQPKKITGELLDQVLAMIKEQRVRLGKSLTMPVGENLRDYQVFEDAAFSFPLGVIWVPVRKPGALHRDLDTIVHEFGHHCFYQMLDGVLHKTNPKKRWTRLQICALAKSMLAVNEFFADYTAVSCGYNIAISIHNYGKLPDEFKRYFSRERTLAEFMKDAYSSPRMRSMLEEGHNSLNPTRSFVWKLKLAIGTEATDKIVVAAVKANMYRFFAADVNKYKRKAVDWGWGCFALPDYPTDIRTENLRFLGFLQDAADKLLTADQKAKFAAEAAKIYGSEYPLKARL